MGMVMVTVVQGVDYVKWKKKKKKKARERHA
jgi:hypothetical protein